MYSLSHAKPVVESYRALRISELKKSPFFFERTFCSHALYFADIKMRLVKDPLAHDWYLNIEKYGPKNRNNTISLIRTPCNYGGYREWFECPDCHGRVGVLYYDEDSFSCRKCLGLGYRSQRMNYQTIAPMVKHWIEFEKMEYPMTYQYYGHKPTKRMLRYEKKEKKAAIGMRMLQYRYGGGR